MADGYTVTRALEEVLTTPETYLQQREQPQENRDPEDPTTNVGVHPGELSIQVYPNPTTGMVNVDIPEGEAYRVTVFDAAGRAVLRTAEAGQQVNLATVPAGTYLLRFTGNRGTAVQRIRKY